MHSLNLSSIPNNNISISNISNSKIDSTSHKKEEKKRILKSKSRIDLKRKSQDVTTSLNLDSVKNLSKARLSIINEENNFKSRLRKNSRVSNSKNISHFGNTGVDSHDESVKEREKSINKSLGSFKYKQEVNSKYHREKAMMPYISDNPKKKTVKEKKEKDGKENVQNNLHTGKIRLDSFFNNQPESFKFKPNISRSNSSASSQKLNEEGYDFLRKIKNKINDEINFEKNIYNYKEGIGKFLNTYVEVNDNKNNKKK